jgi:radical SAM PhpK family P-methyltransferase
MIDCLIVGFNSSSFEEYVEMVRSMGKNSGAYRDLNLAFIEYNNKPHHSLDILNHFYFENNNDIHKKFDNADFLAPVILYLGTYLHRKGLSFDYVNLFQLEKKEFKDKLSENNILTIAITTTFYVSPYPLIEIISFIKKYNTTAKIIVGGPFVANQAKGLDSDSLSHLFKYIGADFYIISSEGELALSKVIQAIKNNLRLDVIDNIAYRENEKYIISSSSKEVNSLEENMVDYNLFPKERFEEFVTLRTCKSCPFSCAFCAMPQRAGKYTYLDVELVEKELNLIKEIGSVSTLTFIDDTFNVPQPRFKEILRMMIKNKYEFKWNSFLRSDHVDEEAIFLMKESGCEGVFLGVESGSDLMLQRMNKTSRRKNYLEAIPLLKNAGIITYASLVIGFPGETFDTVQETIELIEETKPDFFRAQLWYCDPITPILNQREKYEIKGSAFNWSHNSMDAKTACDLVDYLFLSVKNSIWLPQNGFDLWSIFYLQRKGMTIEQIKIFLNCFNAVIKQKLIYPNMKNINSDLLESLKISCLFENVVKPNLHPIELVCNSGYRVAENFWQKRLLPSQSKTIDE